MVFVMPQLLLLLPLLLTAAFRFVTGPTLSILTPYQVLGCDMTGDDTTSRATAGLIEANALLSAITGEDCREDGEE
jgi:hypothetical protein